MTTRHPQVILILAVDSNGVVGKNNDIPWRSLHDFKWFRGNTIDNSTIMGRKTWESLPTKPLPRRNNYVVTSDPNYVAEGAIIVGSVKEAIDLSLRDYPENKVFVIGGKAIWEAATPYANLAYISRIGRKTVIDENCVMMPDLPTNEIISQVDLYEGDEHEPSVKVVTVRFL